MDQVKSIDVLNCLVLTMFADTRLGLSLLYIMLFRDLTSTSTYLDNFHFSIDKTCTSLDNVTQPHYIFNESNNHSLFNSMASFLIFFLKMTIYFEV